MDGVDGAGKTVLADELAVLVGRRRAVLRAGVDDFHRPRTERYARGRGPESFYRDSHDLTALQDVLLRPFRGGRPVRTAVHDVAADAPVRPAPVDPPGDAVLLLDGIFLHRPELAGHWDASVFVDVPFEVSVPRGNARAGIDLPADPAAPENDRYVGGQRIYLERARPVERATWVLDNTDLAAPDLRRPRPGG